MRRSIAESIEPLKTTVRQTTSPASRLPFHHCSTAFARLKRWSALALTPVFLAPPNAVGYEVWMGTHCAPASMATHPQQWRLTASLVEGLNENTAPLKPEPDSPTANEQPASLPQYAQIFGQFKVKDNTLIEIPRSAVAKSSIAQAVDSEFRKAAKLGLSIKCVMFYDNRLQGKMYNWTPEEVQTLRNTLNSTGHSDIRLVYDVRNNTELSHYWSSSPLVNDIMLEATYELWKSNLGQRQQYLKWFWNSPALVHKRLIFQIPELNENAYQDNYKAVRLLVRWLGNDLMNYDFLRSSRVIFMPVTYNRPPMPYYPEVNPDGSQYENTLTGVTLSLIEQRDLFEGRTRNPTVADAESTARNISSKPEPSLPSGR